MAATSRCVASQISTWTTPGTSASESCESSATSVHTAAIDEAESHLKQALLTRQYGMNRN